MDFFQLDHCDLLDVLSGQGETRSHHYYGAVVKAPLWTHAPIIITVAVCRPVRMFQMSYNKNNDDKKELSQHQQQQLGYRVLLLL